MKWSALKILCTKVANHIGTAFIVTIIGRFTVMGRETLNKWNVQQETDEWLNWMMTPLEACHLYGLVLSVATRIQSL